MNSVIEPILQDNKDRFVLFPIKHKEVWGLYKVAENLFWCDDGINFSEDKKDFSKLDDHQKEFIRFAIYIFNRRFSKNLYGVASRFLEEVQYPEARCFYGFQNMMLQIHTEAFSNLAIRFLDGVEPDKIISDTTISNVAKEEWINNNFVMEENFSRRVVAHTIIQSIFHCSVFAGILSFKPRGVMSTLALVTDFVFIDENLFTDFSLSIYSHLKNKLSANDIWTMVREAVDIETTFVKSFSNYFSGIGLTEDYLIQIIKYRANNIMYLLTGKAYYNIIPNPAAYMIWSSNFKRISPDNVAEDARDTVKVGEVRFDLDF